MPRQWSATRAYVRELNNVPSGVNFSYGGRTYLTNVVPDSPVWNRAISQISDGSARFYQTQDWEQFLVPGRVLTVEQPVSGYAGFLVRTLTSFLIEDVEPATNGTVMVSGRGVESLLAKVPVWTPIGEEKVYATALSPQNQTAERTSLAAGVPQGNQAATLTDAADFDIGMTLRIRTGTVNNGPWHAATITNKSGNTVNFSPAIGAAAAVGNDVQGWPAAGGTGAHAPIATTLTIGAPHGMDAATLATVAGIVVGDEIRIRTGTANDGGWFSATVTAVNPPGAPHPNTVQYAPDLIADAAAGNSVEVRAAKLKVYDTSGMAEGQRIEIVMNGGGVRETAILEVSGDDLTVTVRDGLTAAADVGNAATAYDYGARTTADVTQAAQNAPSWQFTFQTGNGSAQGTAFAPKGESVYDILLSITERTGEFFRYSLDASGIPTRRIEWRRTPDASGVTLILYDTDEYARQRADELSATKGAAFSIRRKKTQPLITRIYPSAGDQAISLSSASAEALLYAAVEGCAVHISDDFYEPDYVEHVASVANAKIGVQAIRQTYGDISIEDAGNAEQLGAACDQLLLSAVQDLLQAQLREYFTVEAYIPVALKPGQTVKIENATAVGPAVSTAADYIILEVHERQSQGRSRTTLLVSNMAGLRRTPAAALGNVLRTTAQSLRRVGSSGGGGRVSVALTGGGAVGEHLHPQYLPIAGGTPLVGNMPVADGVTIDGVDISAHAANPNAHHAAVTIVNDGLSLAQQALGLRLSSASPGLTIRQSPYQGLSLLLQSTSGLTLSASGLAIDDGFAGDGLAMTLKVMRVRLDASSGLQFNSGALALGTPLALSATSVNAVTGVTHAHAVQATQDAQTTPGGLLKSGSSGELRLARLGIGVASAPDTALLVAPTLATQTAERIRAAASQSAALWRVENSAGNALLMVTAQGDLQSGSPAFVSGLVGWEISALGRAEFNDAFIRGELHASVFTADELHATGGTLAVMTASRVAAPVGAADNKLPNGLPGSSTFTLNVDASWDTSFCYFLPSDVLRIKTMTRIGGGLDLYDIYVTVNSIGALTGRDLANGNPGWYALNVSWRAGGAAQIVIPTGSAVVRWARSGQSAGAFTGGLILTSDLSYAPYIDVFTVAADQTAASWATPNDGNHSPKPRVRLGNLDGVLGLPQQWGMAAGTDLSDSSAAARYLIASDLQFRLANVDLSIYKAAAEVIRLNSGADGSDPFIAVGHPNIPTGLTSGGSGFYAAQIAATAKTQFRVGHVTGPALRWDGTNLSLHDPVGTAIIRFDSAGGASYFAGPMTLAAATGGLWQGTAGTWASPRGGFKLWNNGGVGTLTFYNDDGSQPLMLDRQGLTLRSDNSYEPGGIGELTFRTAAGVLVGGLDTYYAGINDTAIKLYGSSGSSYGALTIGKLAGSQLYHDARATLSVGATTNDANDIIVTTSNTTIGNAVKPVTLLGAVYLDAGGALYKVTTTRPIVASGHAALYVYKNGAVNELTFQSGPSLRTVLATLTYA